MLHGRLMRMHLMHLGRQKSGRNHNQNRRFKVSESQVSLSETIPHAEVAWSCS